MNNNGDGRQAGEVIATFRGYFSKMSNTRYDELAMTIVVNRDDKYVAMPITDQQGYVYEFTVRKLAGKTVSADDPFELADD